MPFSPSKNVIALLQEPVFLKPGSNVIKFKSDLSLDTSIAFSSSDPFRFGFAPYYKNNLIISSL